MSEEQIVDRIAQEIFQYIESQTNEHLNRYGKFTLNTQSTDEEVASEADSKKQFFKLISSLKDVSVLGRKLLELAPKFSAQNGRNNSPTSMSSANQFNETGLRSAIDDDATSEDLLAALIESSSSDDFLILSSSLESFTGREMILAASIYIRSHECFTLSHDIQGVATVLRRTKFLILNILAPRDQMELITKLLTSIGRYNEMNYVFDLFRVRNQFEILVSKGVDKTPELRKALFNYVKGNSELYPLVTLNFSMFREMGDSLESSAMSRLDRIEISKLNNNSSIKKPVANSTASTSMVISTAVTAGPVSALSSATNSTIDPASLANQTAGSADEAEPPPAAKSAMATAMATAAAATQPATTAGAPVATSAASCNDTVGGGGGSTAIGAGCSEPAALIKEQVDGGGGGSGSGGGGKIEHSRQQLSASLLELVDASDCFAKAGCYKRSNRCESKAKLVALQLALLLDGEEINLLGVPQSELNDLIVSFKTFDEAYIVASAYDCHLAWRQALFKNVVLGGQMDYLDRYCSRCDLSSSLVEELVVLYRRHVSELGALGGSCVALCGAGGGGGSGGGGTGCQASQQCCGQDELSRVSRALQALVERLSDVEMRCKIYTQLSLFEAKQRLLDEPATRAHLKDLRLA